MNGNGHIAQIFYDYGRKTTLLTLEIEGDARRSADELQDRRLTVSLKPYRKHRSVDANAYFHVLVGEIADALRISKPRAKNIMICRYGQQEYLENGQPAVIKTNIPPEAMLEQEALHLWPCGSDGNATFYKLFRGSHSYDTREMSVLIDGTIADAKELGIETLPPDEIKQMEERWNVKERAHR